MAFVVDCSRKGHLQFFMKEYDKALETYEEGLKHDPDNSELKEGIARCIDALNKVRSAFVVAFSISCGLTDCSAHMHGLLLSKLNTPNRAPFY
jgi:tetratricopeptide (TPR) repeat protein